MRAGAFTPAAYPGAFAPAVHPGAFTPAVHPGAFTPAVHPGAFTPAVHPGAFTPAVHPGAFTPAYPARTSVGVVSSDPVQSFELHLRVNRDRVSVLPGKKLHVPGILPLPVHYP